MDTADNQVDDSQHLEDLPAVNQVADILHQDDPSATTLSHRDILHQDESELIASVSGVDILHQDDHESTFRLEGSTDGISIEIHPKDCSMDDMSAYYQSETSHSSLRPLVTDAHMHIYRIAAALKKGNVVIPDFELGASRNEVVTYSCDHEK